MIASNPLQFTGNSYLKNGREMKFDCHLAMKMAKCLAIVVLYAPRAVIPNFEGLWIVKSDCHTFIL